MISLVLLASGVFADQCVATWQQCGGQDYAGSTNCCPGDVCKVHNDWWSMCEPDTNPAPTVPTPEPTLPPSNPTPHPTPAPTRPPSDSHVTPALWTSKQHGDGTYYGHYSTTGAVSEGSTWGGCSLSGVLNNDDLPAYNVDAFVAVGLNNLFEGWKACGMCLKYKSLNGDIGDGIAMVVNACEGCGDRDLDFALNGDGRYNMEWEAVDCPVADKKFQYTFDSSSSQWYLKLQVRNHKVPVAKVEMEHNGVYQEMKRLAGHYLAGTNYTPEMLPSYQTPIKLRITSIFGETVFDTINLSWSQISASTWSNPISGTVQFTQGSNYGSTGSSRRLEGLLHQLD